MTKARAKELVSELLDAKAEARKWYEISDDVLAELLKGVAVGQVIDLDGVRYTIVDHFAETNIGWGHGSIRRFDLEKLKAAREPREEVKEAPKRAKRRVQKSKGEGRGSKAKKKTAV